MKKTICILDWMQYRSCNVLPLMPAGCKWTLRHLRNSLTKNLRYMEPSGTTEAVIFTENTLLKKGHQVTQQGWHLKRNEALTQGDKCMWNCEWPLPHSLGGEAPAASGSRWWREALNTSTEDPLPSQGAPQSSLYMEMIFIWLSQQFSEKQVIQGLAWNRGQ